MKREIASFVYSCLTCQKSKIEHQKPSGLMQPLAIPEWKWDSISMDFVSGLPRTSKNFEAICILRSVIGSFHSDQNGLSVREIS